MKRFMVVLMCLVVMCSEAWAAYYDEGNDGNSWETAYVIDSVEDLKTMKSRNETGKYYKMTADIDLSSETDWDNFYFRGHFDGQNHTIRLNSTENRLYAGLFNTVDNDDAVIRNLNVTGHVEADCAGTIVHYLSAGLVENCSFNGTIIYESSGNSFGAGGLIAHVEGGTVRNCRVNADISGRYYAGGIAGEMSGGNIENCTADVRLTSGKYIGGIVGMSNEEELYLSGNTWPSDYPQVGTGQEGTEPPDTPDTPETASAEWNGHRYQIYNENLTWEQAKAKCESLGGHLATITSQKEQSFIERLLRNSELEFYGYWLGAKADDSGWWHWVTDEVFERQYANFALGQPDGAGYLQIFTPDSELSQYELYTFGKWDDTTNDGTGAGPVNQHGFICEWDEEQKEITAAPPANDFVDWQAHPENWKNDGVLPDPVDNSHLRNNPPKISVSDASFVRAADTLPVSFDGRIAFGLPEARNQGAFNTCWAFASIGALEANYKAQKMTVLGDNPDLSELHMAWFAYKDADSNSSLNDTEECILNQRGSAKKAEALLNRGIAPVNESDMNYSAAGTIPSESDAKIEAFLNGRSANDFKKVRISLKDNENIQIDKFAEEVNPNTVPDMKRFIMTNGAVYFQYYDDKDGYHNDTFYSKNRQYGNLHAALLVGWDDNYPRENFNPENRPDKNGAWLVRNSKTPHYFWMSYSQSEKAQNDRYGIEQDGYVFTVREESEDIADNVSDDKGLDVKEHDENGRTKNISSQWSAAIFHSDRNEDLTRINFKTTDNNAKYTIFVNNLGKNKPTDPGKAEEALETGEISHSGSHTIDLASPVSLCKGDYYSVIIKMELNSNYDYPTGVEASIERYVKASVNEGESFFADGEEVPSVWQDGKYIEGGPYDACIKAVTIGRSDNRIAPSITTTSIPDAYTDKAYSFQFIASGSDVIEWRAGGLPSGMALSRGGLLTGQPVESGEYEIKITAFNDVDVSMKTFELKVSGSDTPGQDEPDEPDEPELDPEQHQKQKRKSSGGGCNSFMNLFCAVFVIALRLRRR